MTRVLLVDDEEPLRASLTFTLRKEGYEVTCAADGPTALELARDEHPDVILLDLMLPGLDGIEVARRLRTTSDVPILMLTAKDQESDKVLGLEIGADDYVTKPFSTRELLARIKTVLRRRNVVRLAHEDRELLTRMEAAVRQYGAPELREPMPEAATDGALVLPERGILHGPSVTIDLDRHEVRARGKLIELSPKEFQLLRALVAHQGRVVSRDQLIQTVWGDEFMGDQKTLDVHMRWLREKIEADPSSPQHIVTVRGVGYRFE
jgi:two-component system, OmpR family, response regulator RegX3